MKNNNNELNITEKTSNDVELSFTDRVKDLKDKIAGLKELNIKYDLLQKEAKSLADQFVLDFKQDKVELGKIVSWLDNRVSGDELLSLIGDSVSEEDVKSLSVKIYNRLLDPFNQPENSSNSHITNLVNTLNVYDNFIESFESIEVEDDSNCLSRKSYLISDKLHDTLVNGFRLERNRDIVKEEKGIYMVVFKVIKNKGEDVLIYKYIKYPYIFYDTLCSYIMKESGSFVMANDRSVGVDYLFIMNPFFKDRDEMIDVIRYLAEGFKHKILYKISRGIYPRNIIDLCKSLLKGCPVFLNNTDITKLIKLISERKTFEVATELVKLYDFYRNETEGLKMLQDKLKKPNLEKFNFLGRCVFVTEDLNSLITELDVALSDGISQESNKLKVNQGPRKWRGQSDSLSHVINSIDTDFRKSLNRHNQYHVNVGNIPRNRLIGRSKFHYQNIHLNIGNVRWYSSTSNATYTKPIINNNTSVFNEIAYYLKNAPINKDTQLKIENSLLEQSYIKLNEKMNSSDGPTINYNLISNSFTNLLISERDHLLDYINRSRKVNFNKIPTKTKMKAYVQYEVKSILDKLEDNFIISVVYGRLLKIVSKNDYLNGSNQFTDVVFDLANDLINNYYYKLYIERKKELNTNNYNLTTWKIENQELISKLDEIKGEIGGTVLTWLKNLDLVWIKLVVKGQKEKENIVLPTDKVLKVLKKEDKIKPLPRKFPMIIKPSNYHQHITKDGVSQVLGGYYLNGEKYTDNLIIDKWRFGKSCIIHDENILYDLVNNIGSVGYKVNKDVFDFITVYGIEYGLIMNPNHGHPLLLKEKLTKLEHIELSSFLSRLELQDNILGLAEIFSNVHEFFIPVRLDFTGRLYCMSEYLNYQSSELAKSLLLFSTSEKFAKNDTKAIKYLKAYGANCFGNKLDKKSWNDRIKWVDDNIEEIINFKNGNLIKKAEKKLLFVAFCFELNRLLDCINNECDYLETAFPIQLDGTCNGYQHLAMLSMDNDLAEEVNLGRSSWDDEPKDFYSFTAARLINFFQDLLQNYKLSPKDEEACVRFSNLTIARKIVKKAIMTIVFNVSHQKIISYLQESFIECEEQENVTDKKDKWFYFADDISIKLKDSDFPILATGLKQILGDGKFKLNKLLNYLNESARICTKLGLYIPWISPSSGVNINQSYLTNKETRLKVFSYSKQTFSVKAADRKKVKLKGTPEEIWEYKYDKGKQVRAYMPNLIHSLDADALALLVHYYFTDRSSNIKNIYTIHDCFAVTANNVESLINLLKIVYQKIYTNKPYLRNLHNGMIEHIKRHYGEESIDKDLNVNTVPFKGKFPSIDDILLDDMDIEKWIKDASYILN